MTDEYRYSFWASPSIEAEIPGRLFFEATLSRLPEYDELMACLMDSVNCTAMLAIRHVFHHVMEKDFVDEEEGPYTVLSLVDLNLQKVTRHIITAQPAILKNLRQLDIEIINTVLAKTAEYADQHALLVEKSELLLNKLNYLERPSSRDGYNCHYRHEWWHLLPEMMARCVNEIRDWQVSTSSLNKDVFGSHPLDFLSLPSDEARKINFNQDAKFWKQWVEDFEEVKVRFDTVDRWLEEYIRTLDMIIGHGYNRPIDKWEELNEQEYLRKSKRIRWSFWSLRSWLQARGGTQNHTVSMQARHEAFRKQYLDWLAFVYHTGRQ
ncbi:hypothetical protein F5Y18DRAFT_321523 [Xylariaceae sp. FL1019]|nr:hypothetical protein F5Y18DRAFT_321523 [Xylariaceae sp. FL1019]